MLAPVFAEGSKLVAKEYPPVCILIIIYLFFSVLSISILVSILIITTHE